MKFGKNLFQTKVLLRLSHMVYRLLPSPVLLRKVTTTVKPVLSGHRIKRTPSIKRTVAEVPKYISLIYFKTMKPLLSGHLY